MNKVVIVTGGASGIGQAVVERLARDNFTVVILDIDEEGGKQVAAEIQGHGKPAAFIALDVTEKPMYRKLFTKSSPITAASMSLSTLPEAVCIDIQLESFLWTIGERSSTPISHRPFFAAGQ